MSWSNVFFPKPRVTCQYILKKHILKLANNQVFIKQIKNASLSNHGSVVGNGKKEKVDEVDGWAAHYSRNDKQ